MPWLATDDGRSAYARVVAPASPDALDAVHQALEGFWNWFDRVYAGHLPSAWRIQFATAVVEIATNVVRHANPGGPANNRHVVEFCTADGAVVACLTDQGLPFAGQLGPSSPGGTPVPDDLEAIPEAGYGLAPAQVCVDELSYERRPDGTNCWTFRKTFG
jgi:anti-sigma regulatory factor (Ser/Thr protein kinase)